MNLGASDRQIGNLKPQERISKYFRTKSLRFHALGGEGMFSPVLSNQQSLVTKEHTHRDGSVPGSLAKGSGDVSVPEFCPAAVAAAQKTGCCVTDCRCLWLKNWCAAGCVLRRPEPLQDPVRHFGGTKDNMR